MLRKFLVFGMSALLLVGSAGSVLLSGHAAHAATAPAADYKELIGRWDITVDENGKSAPSWLEVKLSGTRTLVGYFVASSGSARPVSKVNFNDGKFDFTIPPQWEKGEQDFVIKGELSGGGIEGTMVTSEGKEYKWKGVKAPYLKRTAAPVGANPSTCSTGKTFPAGKR